MVKVHDFNKWLDFGSFCDLFLAHSLGDLERVTFDTSDNGVRIWTVLGSLVKVFDDDSFLTGLTALKKKDNLRVLDKKREE
jgi:hypothetical protein